MIKMVRDGEGNTFPACDPCWLANRDGLVIVPGPVTVTAHCDECLEFIYEPARACRAACSGEGGLPGDVRKLCRLTLRYCLFASSTNSMPSSCCRYSFSRMTGIFLAFLLLCRK